MIGFVKIEDNLVKIYDQGSDVKCLSNLKIKETWHSKSKMDQSKYIERAINSHLKANYKDTNFKIDQLIS